MNIMRRNKQKRLIGLIKDKKIIIILEREGYKKRMTQKVSLNKSY